ncbi:ABC transporter permease [Brevibacillus fluminis]|uniref:ABC transporter permease n=1 Tax=Brevibacillus fluminis TaxID=511487 RepID=A0A3M8DI60_9BACL|nr:ABC transporter permease [Brevibacillus fluminis]RNB87289.1 ABC transporter permease [Brevibacillus fluminis]
MRAKTRKILQVYSILVYMFLYIPIAVLIVYSFNDSEIITVWQGFTLRWYHKMFGNGAIFDAAQNSILIACLTTVFSSIVGTMAALVLHRHKIPGKKIIDTLFYIPIVIPPIIVAVALLAMFAWAKITLGIGTITVGHVVMTISFVTLIVLARLQGFDKTLEEAAMDLGANNWVTFWRVTLPLIAPSIFAGALLTFTISLDEFVMTFFTTGPGINTLPILIYSMVKTGVTPEVNALSTVLILLTVLIVFVAEKWRGSAKAK